MSEQKRRNTRIGLKMDEQDSTSSTALWRGQYSLAFRRRNKGKGQQDTSVRIRL